LVPSSRPSPLAAVRGLLSRTAFQCAARLDRRAPVSRRPSAGALDCFLVLAVTVAMRNCESLSPGPPPVLAYGGGGGPPPQSAQRTYSQLACGVPRRAQLVRFP
jgi:hypothetical protein